MPRGGAGAPNTLRCLSFICNRKPIRCGVANFQLQRDTEPRAIKHGSEGYSRGGIVDESNGERWTFLEATLEVAFSLHRKCNLFLIHLSGQSSCLSLPDQKPALHFCTHRSHSCRETSSSVTTRISSGCQSESCPIYGPFKSNILSFHPMVFDSCQEGHSTLRGRNFDFPWLRSSEAWRKHLESEEIPGPHENH